MRSRKRTKRDQRKEILAYLESIWHSATFGLPPEISVDEIGESRLKTYATLCRYAQKVDRVNDLWAGTDPILPRAIKKAQEEDAKSNRVRRVDPSSLAFQLALRILKAESTGSAVGEPERPGSTKCSTALSKPSPISIEGAGHGQNNKGGGGMFVRPTSGDSSAQSPPTAHGGLLGLNNPFKLNPVLSLLLPTKPALPMTDTGIMPNTRIADSLSRRTNSSTESAGRSQSLQIDEETTPTVTPSQKRKREEHDPVSEVLGKWPLTVVTPEVTALDDLFTDSDLHCPQLAALVFDDDAWKLVVATQRPGQFDLYTHGEGDFTTGLESDVEAIFAQIPALDCCDINHHVLPRGRKNAEPPPISSTASLCLMLEILIRLQNGAPWEILLKPEKVQMKHGVLAEKVLRLRNKKAKTGAAGHEVDPSEFHTTTTIPSRVVQQTLRLQSRWQTAYHHVEELTSAREQELQQLFTTSQKLAQAQTALKDLHSEMEAKHAEYLSTYKVSAEEFKRQCDERRQVDEESDGEAER